MRNETPSSRRVDGERPPDDSLFERRRVLQAGAAATLAAVAGCLADDESDDAPDDSDEDDGADTAADEAEEDPADDSSALLDVIDAYLEAAADGDAEGVSEVTHGSSPLDPAAWEDEGWEFRGGDGEALGEYETEVVTTDGSIEDVLDLEAAAFWFDEDDLAEEIGDEDIALVELEAGADGADAENAGIWVLVTEADEWRVFFVGEEDDAPADPEEAFEEELLDEEAAVVEEVDWDFEQDAQDEDGPFGDVEWAQVVLTDDPGLEADRVVIESTIEGSEFEFYGEEPNAWAGSYANLAFHPAGDQIVVTVVRDGEETVVHREHYLP